MPNLLHRGQSMLNRHMKAAAGATVTYTRAAGQPTEQTATLVAEVGLTRPQNTADGNVLLTYGERDYLIDVADLVLGGVAVEPQTEPFGDRITETINGVATTFEIMTPANGEPAWRYSDATRTKYRLHTKKV